MNATVKPLKKAVTAKSMQKTVEVAAMEVAMDDIGKDLTEVMHSGFVETVEVLSFADELRHSGNDNDSYTYENDSDSHDSDLFAEKENAEEEDMSFLLEYSYDNGVYLYREEDSVVKQSSKNKHLKRKLLCQYISMATRNIIRLRVKIR